MAVTLKDIKKSWKKVSLVAEFYHNKKAKEVALFSGSGYTVSVSGGDDVSLLKAVKKDLDGLAKQLHSIKDLYEAVNHYDSFNKEEEEVKTEINNLFKKSSLFAGIDLSKDLGKEDIKAKVYNLSLKLSRKSYLSAIKTLEKREDEAPIVRTIKYPLYKEAFEVLAKVQKLVKGYSVKRASLSENDRSKIDQDIFRNRAMADSVLKKSTYINNGKVENKAHKPDLAVFRLAEKLYNHSFVGAVEIDPAADIKKVKEILAELEFLNLALHQKFFFKVRKLGNYNANGICFQELRIVAIDLDCSSSVIHEITHLIDYDLMSNDRYKTEREQLAAIFRNKMGQTAKEGYYKSTSEIIARLGEIAFLLMLEDKNIVGTPKYLVKERQAYEDDSAIYFDFKNWGKIERKIVKEFYGQFFLGEKQLPAKEFSPLARKLKEKEAAKSSRGHSYKSFEKMMKDIYQGVTGDAIQEIIDNSEVPLDELADRLIRNVQYWGANNRRMGFNEWVEMTTSKAKVIYTLEQTLEKSILEDIIKDFSFQYIKANVALLGNRTKGREVAFFKEVEYRIANHKYFDEWFSLRSEVKRVETFSKEKALS